MKESLLKIYLEGISVADINKTKLRRQTNYRNTSIKTLKCDNFYIGVDITPDENLT